MSFLNDILNLLMPLSSKKITNNDEKSIFETRVTIIIYRK